ncbi:MAG: DUF3108 domain-containing protein [Gammaproteobacteria bacterium]|nr:MAG: DUF3108 domain-containing protein [Gammaproteobacteria bacterium]
MEKIILTFIAVYILAQPAWSNPTSVLNESNLPPEFEATYDVHKGSMRVGKMNVSLKKVGDELIYESITKPVGMAALFLGDQVVTDRAILKLIDNNYHTVEFTHVMKNSDKDRNEHYVFDWNNNKVAVKYKGRNDELDAPEYTFDNYSAQLLLMREPDADVSTNIYSVISKGRIKEYKYQLESTELIETKIGKFNANKYVRKKDNDKKTTYLGWYAEELNYIPVKLDKFENEKLDVSIRITSVKWLNEESSN